MDSPINYIEAIIVLLTTMLVAIVLLYLARNRSKQELQNEDEIDNLIKKHMRENEKE